MKARVKIGPINTSTLNPELEMAILTYMITWFELRYLEKGKSCSLGKLLTEVRNQLEYKLENDTNHSKLAYNMNLNYNILSLSKAIENAPTELIELIDKGIPDLSRPFDLSQLVENVYFDEKTKNTFFIDTLLTLEEKETK